MNDERYDQSADMRLLDLQRRAIGADPHVLDASRHAEAEPQAERQSNLKTRPLHGTIIVSMIDAQPNAALIPGALVTVSLSLANEGDTAARALRLNLPLPVAMTYRPGSMLLDGTAQDDALASDFFADGYTLDAIEPGKRRTLVVRLVVEFGLTPLMLVPHVSCAGAAVLGPRAMRLARSEFSVPARAVVERPFYESDEAEHAVEPLAPARALSIVQPVELPPVLVPQAQAPPAPEAFIPSLPAVGAVPAAPPAPAVPASPAISPPPVPPAPAVAAEEARAARPARTPKPRTRAKTKAKASAGGAERATKTRIESVSESVVESPRGVTFETVRERTGDVAPAPAIEIPAAVAQPPRGRETAPAARRAPQIVGQGGPVLTVSIDRKRLATLARLFSGPSLGMIAHYLVLNALAAIEPLAHAGTDDSLIDFVVSQEQLLSRALIATRLGKTPAPESVGAALPAFPPAIAASTGRVTLPRSREGEAVLARAFGESEMIFLGRMLANDQAPPFLRSAQLFVGLCANDVAIEAGKERKRVATALSAYAAAATAEISRIFLRAKITRKPALFKETEPAFDDAARNVLEALGQLPA